MKNVQRITTKFYYSVFLILLSFLLLHTVQSSESTLNLPDTEDVLQTSSSDNNESQDWILIPGSTKLLLIQLQGRNEEIVFEFNSSEAENTAFTLSTIVNGSVINTENKQFLQEETLSAKIDYQTKEVSVIGDNGFSISQPIQDDFYDVTVLQKRASDPSQEVYLIRHSNSKTPKIIFGTIGGSLGLVAVLIIFCIVWRKRKTLLQGVISQGPETLNLGNKLNGFQNVNVNKEAEKQSTSRPDVEVGSKLALDSDLKSANSQISTLATINRLETQVSNANNKSVLSSNFKNGNHTDCGTITEIDDEKESIQNKMLIMKNNKPVLQSQEPVTPKTNSKFPPKRKSQSIHEENVALDLDMELDGGGRRMPTVVEIKALVRKMEQEGAIQYECDPSEDTDEEDQYEAPALPNYFCCMVCFEGRRCTVVEPCRHVFACHGCVKELLASYKICVLCAGAIDSYEAL